MGQMKFSNNAITTLYAGIGAGATTLNVAPGTGDNFPQVTGGSGDFFIITMEDASGNIEMIRCDHRAAASDTMGNGSYPLQRAYYDATRFPARAWNAGDAVDNRPIAAALSSVGMMGANNLGEITNAATARTNLGLGSMAIEAAATYQTVAGMSAYQTTAGMSAYQTVSGMSAYQTVAGMSAYVPIAGGQFTGAALFKSGPNNKASAATVDLTAIGANTCHITGTTGISAWTMTSGQVVDVVFDGALTLTHHATNNNLPGAANITTAAGDRARYWYDGTAVWCVAYQRADGSAIGGGGGKVQDFRLTLTSGTPVTTADVTGATTIYCTPYRGNQIALYSGSAWNVRASAEFSLALGTLTSGLPYDVFCYDNAGTPKLEFLAWTNGTTRATALVMQDGVLCKSGALTRRYLGTFYTSSTTATEDSAAKRYLFNYYNQKDRPLSGTFSADRSTSSTTYAELNSEIQIKYVLGVAEDLVGFSATGSVHLSASYGNIITGIGLDSTSAAGAGLESITTNPAGEPGGVAINGAVNQAVGYHYATLLGMVKANTGTWGSSTSTSTSNGVQKTYLKAVVKG